MIPNLLVSGIPAAMEQSKAVKAYFVNLMWQPGETIGFSRFGPRSLDSAACPEAEAGLCDPEFTSHPSGFAGALRQAGSQAGGE